MKRLLSAFTLAILASIVILGQVPLDKAATVAPSQMKLDFTTMVTHAWNNGPDAFGLRREQEGTAIGPSALAYHKGRIFVLDTVKGYVREFDKSGNAISTVVLPFAEPSDLVVDPSTSSLFIANERTGELCMVTASGAVVILPSFSQRRLVFPAKLLYDTDSQTLFVQDSAVHRNLFPILHDGVPLSSDQPAQLSAPTTTADIQGNNLILSFGDERRSTSVDMGADVSCVEDIVADDNNVVWALYTLKGDFRIRRLLRMDRVSGTANVARIGVWFPFDATRHMAATENGVVLFSGDMNRGALIRLDYAGLANNGDKETPVNDVGEFHFPPPLEMSSSEAYDPNWTKAQCDTYSYDGLYETYCEGGDKGWVDNNYWDGCSIEGVDCSSYASRCLALPSYLAENNTAGTHPYTTRSYYCGLVSNVFEVSDVYSLEQWDVWVFRYNPPTDPCDINGTGHMGLFKEYNGAYITTREARGADYGVIEYSRSKANLIDLQAKFWRRSAWGTGTPPSNDNCSSAQLVYSNSSCSYTHGTIENATASSIQGHVCDNPTSPTMYDVWYYFTAVASAQTVKVVPDTTAFDAVVAVYGSCSSASPLTGGCQDYGGGGGGIETLNLTGLSVGSTYWVRVFHNSSTLPNPTGAGAGFQICVTGSATCTAPAITTQPQSQSITSGQTATLNVAASGTSPTYQWYRGSSGDTSYPVGSNSTSYTTPALTATTSYWVKASNSCGSANSNTATITVGSTCTAPAITAQPQSQSITSGQTATLNVAASGTSPTYQWYRGSSGDTSYPVGSNSTSYTTPALTATTSYWVKASNSCGSANSNTATITVGSSLPDLVITAFTAPSTGTIGGQIQFSATVANQGPAGAGAYRLGIYFSTDATITTSDPCPAYCSMSALTSGSSQGCSGPVDIPASLSPGVYYVGVYADDLAAVSESNEGNNTQSLQITLSSTCTAPAITTQPQSQSITSGQTATLTVAASGTSPTYQWYRGSSGDTSYPVGSNSTSYTTPALTATTSYWARASNSCGSANSNTATITVGSTCTAPAITTQPQNQSITSGQTATLTVAASGTSPTYQWYRGSSGDTSYPVGSNSTSYTTPALTATTSYWAKASNSCGSANSNTATITVGSTCTAPAITTQPQNQSITSGQTATLTVAASGTSPTYQWYRGSSGDTSYPVGSNSTSYTTPALTATTSYWANASNSCGSANSNTATITVGSTLPDLVITAFTAPSTGTIGGQVQISTTVANQGPGSAGAYRLGIYISTDAVITTSDLCPSYCSMSALSSGSSQGCSGPVSIPASLSPGTYYIGVYADDLGAVSESNEGNNTQSLQITLSSTCTSPSITTQPQSQSITSGQTATLTVAASGTSPTYQWYQGSSGDTSYPVGSNSTSYTTPALTATTSYWARASNSCGSANSNTATITVGSTCTAPAITTQPQNQSITSGQTATLTVAASGTSPTYQWYRGSSGDTSYPVGSNSTSYTTPALTATTSYWAKASNSCGSANSNTATITVGTAQSNVAYAIHVNTDSAGELVSFSLQSPGSLNVIGATGRFLSGGSFLGNDYSRLYCLDFDNNQLVAVSTSDAAVSVIGTCTPVSGTNWTGLTDAGDGTFYASSSNNSNSTLYKVNSQTGTPTIIGSISGVGLIIDVALDAHGNLFGLDITNDTLVSINRSSAAGTPIGAIGFDANYAQGMCFDKATNQLYLAAMRRATSGGIGELRTCSTSSGATTVIGTFENSWEMDSFGITAASSCYDLTTSVNPSGGGTVSVNTDQNCAGGYTNGSVISLTANPTSEYHFTGWTGSGGTFFNTSSASTTFTITGTATVTAAFALNPCSISCAASGNPASGVAPLPVYFSANTTVSGCSGTVSFDWNFGDSSDHSASQNPTHTYATAGTYNWTMTASLNGTICSKSGTVTVSQPACVLSCTASASPSNGQVPLAVNFSATATPTGCSGSPSFNWSFGDGYSSTLQNPSHTFSSIGSYTWTMTASLNGATCVDSGTVTVTSPCTSPLITVQPPSQSISSGQTATLAVTATGTSLSYQWYQGSSGNTSILVGSNSNSYTTPTLTTSTSYWVRVSNACGSDDSVTATINVQTVPPPSVVAMTKMTLPFRIMVAGGNLQPGLSVYINGSLWSNVTWKSLGTVVIKSGISLKTAVPTGVPTQFTFVNPDGGTITKTWQW